ncbi:hypothetical protein QE152_g36521 [Popillia japonica]|uniref:Uncharacterized protein n=1 Tax=Popillia japonica TaxID=7064 RepID=A0AAW1ICP5_POPJA
MVCTTVEAVRMQDIPPQMHGQAVLDLFFAAISEDLAHPERASGPSIRTPTVDSRPTPDAPPLGSTKPRIHTTDKPELNKCQTATDMAQGPSYVGEGQQRPTPSPQQPARVETPAPPARHDTASGPGDSPQQPARVETPAPPARHDTAIGPGD